MQIKAQGLAAQLQQQRLPLYLLTGQDLYLLEQAAETIRNACKSQADCEVQRISLDNKDDWQQLAMASQSYALFASLTLIDCQSSKKSLDAEAKQILDQIATGSNSQVVVMIRAYEMPAKAFQPWAAAKTVGLIQAYAMDERQKRSWILQQFQQAGANCPADLPDLILAQTQGNLFAAAQAIEKMLLTREDGEILWAVARQHLSDQSDYQLYELAEACLLGKADLAIRQIDTALESRTEPTLLLWLLTQEIRLLIRLKQAVSQGAAFAAACQQLKIWPQKQSLYQQAQQQCSLGLLTHLLQRAATADRDIKSRQAFLASHHLHQIALGLALRRLP